MPPKKDGLGARHQNAGHRPGFRTDTAISGSRFGHERVLQPWVPDDHQDDGGLESLEGPSNARGWDQFAENERLFGLKTDYDENIYTTAIDKNHPQYNERVAAAEKKAREIERSAPVNAHVAEERIMDWAGDRNDEDGDEEDKYSGVHRQDFPPLPSSSSNKYTPPAKRAPTGHATAPGVPVDPAIISSQLKVSGKKAELPKSADGTPATAVAVPGKIPLPKPKIPISDEIKPAEAPKQTPAVRPVQPVLPLPLSKASDAKTAQARQQQKQQIFSQSDEKGSPETDRPVDAKPLPPTRMASVAARNIPAVKEPITSAALTVERDVLKSFKNFAHQQRVNAEKVRSSKAKADKEEKLAELRSFAQSFKLSTPIPVDLIGIIAKDPTKQREIQAKARENAEELARQRAATAVAEKEKVAANAVQGDSGTSKDAKISTNPTDTSTGQPTLESSDVSTVVGEATFSSTQPPTEPASTLTTSAITPSLPTHDQGPGAGHPSNKPTGRAHGPGAPGVQNRHLRQNFGQPYQHFRNPGPHVPPQNRTTGNLSQRLRNMEQQHKGVPAPAPHTAAALQGPSPMPVPPMPVPPTGVSAGPPIPPAVTAPSMEPSLSSRRLGTKLNPNSHEFRPSAFAAPFTPMGPSVTSSPQPMANPPVAVGMANGAPVAKPPLIRKKTKAVDVEKCNILAFQKTIVAPAGKNWDDNASLRPSYDTPPTWRQQSDENDKDSTMSIGYKEYFERNPFVSGSAVATPVPGHVIPQSMPPPQGPLPVPVHGGAGHNLAPRQSPHITTLPMHGGPMPPHSGVPGTSGGFVGGMDDHRMMHSDSAHSYASPRMSHVPGGYPPLQSPAVPYAQPLMSPNLGQFRSFSNNGQFVPPHSGPMMMMLQPQFMPGPTPYQGGPVPTMPPGSNGFSSPGRPTAPMMAPSGSQGGHPGFGMSPGMQYNQPAFVPPQQPGGPMNNGRGYGGMGGEGPPYGPNMHPPYARGGGGGYGHKNFHHGHNHSNNNSGPHFHGMVQQHSSQGHMGHNFSHSSSPNVPGGGNAGVNGSGNPSPSPNPSQNPSDRASNAPTPGSSQGRSPNPSDENK